MDLNFSTLVFPLYMGSVQWVQFLWYFSGIMADQLDQQVELIIGSAPHRPFIRLYAMPAHSFILSIGRELLFFSIFQALRIPNPFKLSSQDKGAPARPKTYMIIEDIIAVDTRVGRTSYRIAIDERYEAHPMCRNMLHQLDLLWAIPALSVGAGLMAAVVDNRVPKAIAYGVGTSMAMIHCRSPMLTCDKLGRPSTFSASG